MFIVRWLMSKTVRHATDLRKQVLKLVNEQQDLLKPADIIAIKASALELQAAVSNGADNKFLKTRMDALEKVAIEKLKPYPDGNMRENVEVILVAIAVAMAIRTFFLQPFKIPTGSMQPTLYGIDSEKLSADFKIPSGWDRFVQTMKGYSYVHEVAEEDGTLDDVGRPWPPLFFSIYQTYTFNKKTHIIWFPPEYGNRTLSSRAESYAGRDFKKGDDIFKLRVISGDHLFVDRLTYNFRRPARGEIVVFATLGIKHDQVPEDQFYIKRLVGLPGESVSIDSSHHLVINGQRLDASTPHFQNVYTIGSGPKENPYLGHNPVEKFSDPRQTYPVGKKRFLVMGDNTMNSLDSRYWGDVSEENFIGKAAFVYWPLSSRFGLRSY